MSGLPSYLQKEQACGEIRTNIWQSEFCFQIKQVRISKR